MILTCPECTKQFKVPSDKIGAEGRMVRCQACKTKWFVEAPDFADVLNETGDAGKDVSAAIDSYRESEEAERERQELERRAREDIAEERAKARAAARAAQGHVPKERQVETEAERGEPQKNPVLSVCVGVIAFLLLILVTLPFHQALSTAWAPLGSLYAMIGFSSEVPGEGLVFDSVTVTQDGKSVKLDGRIINLTAKETVIPSIGLHFLPAGTEQADTEKDNLAAPVSFTLPQGEMKGESELNFTHVEPLPQNLADKDFQVKLEFSSTSH